MDKELARVNILLQQSKYDLAEKELRTSLTHDPENPVALSLLSYCFSCQDKSKDAIETAKNAVGIAPDLSITHYFLSVAYMSLDNYKEAEKSIMEAIRIDPDDSDFFRHLAHIKISQRDWGAALDAANKGLELDPEDEDILNARAMVLQRKKMKLEASETIDASLSKNPENANTHATKGWTLLEQGKRKEAMAYFRESLRLSPNNDWARRGLLEALKAGNPLYRIIIAWFFFISRLQQKSQWAVILGLYFLFRVARTVQKSVPELAPFIFPFTVAYMIFAYMTWLASPLMNLCLRLHPFGKYALSDDEIKASNYLGAAIVVALVSFCSALLFNFSIGILISVMCLIYCIPLTTVFKAHDKGKRKTLAIMTVAIAAMGVIGLLGMQLNIPQMEQFFTGFFLCCFLFQFVAMGILSK